MSENRVFVEDKVYRVFGILKYVRNIFLNEVLKFIFDVRMGISMGIIKEIIIDKLDVFLNLI